MNIILLIIVIYLGYQLLFNLIIPVYKTSRKIKQGFREMHQRMQNQQKNDRTSPQPAPPSHSDEYIDFEEISE